ncbi:MAG: 2-hydroxychromene-2-carboxylate isomerase [Deltaproteobacteria bacterium]|nr:2-hydroxychromene-2-carboxylate isomerase [Deltaproteobacteria bacterium]
MSRTIDYYFDFMSPFAYLATQQLVEIASKHDCVIDYRPIELPRAKLAAGNDGPSNQKIPAKLKYMIADLTRWAEHYGIPFNPITGQDSARMNTGTFYAIDRNQADAYVAEGFRLGYVEGSDLNDDSVLAALARSLGWQIDEFMAFLESSEGRDRYEVCNLEAHEREVFGVPMMMLGDEMWWGNDRLDFLDRFLSQA